MLLLDLGDEPRDETIFAGSHVAGLARCVGGYPSARHARNAPALLLHTVHDELQKQKRQSEHAAAVSSAQSVHC